MRPVEKFQKSIAFLRTIYKLIGQDVLADAFHRGRIFYINFFLFFTEISFLSIDLLATDDLSEATRITQACMLIGLVQILIKYCFLKDLYALHAIVTFLKDIYQKNSQPSDEYYGICRRYAQFTELLFKVTAICYPGIVVFIMISGLVESFLTMQPAYCFYIPFIHEYSVVQLALLDAFIGIISVLNVVAMPAGDLFIYLIVANFTMIPLFIGKQMKKMPTELQQHQMNVTEIKCRWMHYILIHQKYVRWE